nr:CHAD domain-containing protein [uncultured Ruegeria sp.]
MVRLAGVYVVEGKFDPLACNKGLKGLALRVEGGDPAQSFNWLDCHDQSLGSAGSILLEVGETLRLLQGNAEFPVQKGAGTGKFVQDLPDGPVRDALNGFPKLRALMNLGAGDLEIQEFAAVDDLEKTRVRGELISLKSENRQATLVRVRSLRGYEPAYETICAALQETAGDEGGLDVVYPILFPETPPYQSKPIVLLGKEEPSIEVAVDLMRTFLAVARRNEAGVIADIDTEFLHDYRVSLRRVRSVLSLFKGVFSPAHTNALKRQFSDLMAPTGRLRDLDVYLLEKDMYFSLIPPNLHEGVEAMFRQFQTERAQNLSSLSRRFRSAAYQKQMDDLAALLAAPQSLQPGPNAERGAYQYACALIWKRYRKVCKRARRISPMTPDKAVHDLRIDCKKLRYLMEFFAPLFDAKAFKSIIKPLKKLQDNLGRFNDCSVQQDALLGFVTKQSNTQGRVDAQMALAAGGLISVLDQRQKSERDRVIANFNHFDSPDIRHLFRSLFHHKGD